MNMYYFICLIYDEGKPSLRFYCSLFSHKPTESWTLHKTGVEGAVNDRKAESSLGNEHELLCLKIFALFSSHSELWHYKPWGTSIIQWVNDTSNPWIFQLLCLTSTRHAGAVPAQQLLGRGCAGAQADLPTPTLWSQLVEQIAIRLGLDLVMLECRCCPTQGSHAVAPLP